MRLDRRLLVVLIAVLSAPAVARPEICHDYNGTVNWIGRSDACDNNPAGCRAGAGILSGVPPNAAIGQFDGFFYPGGSVHYQDALTGHPVGGYYFVVSTSGGGFIAPVGPVGDSTCVEVPPGSQCINSVCSGGFLAELHRGDEPPEIQGPEPPPSPEPPPPPPNTGCPVNVMNGNTWFKHTDVVVPGLGGGLEFVRSYNSRPAREGRSGVFGPGWTHSYEKSITLFPPSVLKLRDASGSVSYYQDDDEDSVYAAMLPKVQESWIVKSGTIYTRHFRAGGAETYDVASGALLSLVDASGNTTQLTRDGSGRLIGITAPSGRALTLTYDPAGKLGSLSGPAGVVASYSYDVSGRLTLVRYPDGSGHGYGYDGSSQVVAVTDGAGRVVELHAYDGQGRATTSELAEGREKLTIAYTNLMQASVTDALGRVTVYDWQTLRGNTPRITRITGPCRACGDGTSGTREWTYDEMGRVLTHTDGGGHTTTYTYNPAGNLATSTDALNQTTAYTYDAQGRVTTRTDPDTAVTSTTYGPAGPLTVTDPLNRITSLSYDGEGKVIAITDARQKTTTFSYTPSGDLSSATDPLGHATTFSYDALGRRTAVTDALSHTTTTAYDARGRVTRITAHDGTHTDFTYDLSGRRTSVRDPLGRATYYLYDVYGRLEKVVDPANGITRYAYDLMGDLTSLTDAKGQATSFQYDGYDRVSMVSYPGGASESFTYDTAGRLATRTDRKGVVTSYGYDALGRLTGKTYSDGTTPAVSYTYDVMGRMLTAANGTDTLSWVYDLAGQLTSEQSSKNGSTVAYTYDDAGNRLSVGLGGQVFVSYGYDDASRLVTINRGSNVFGFGYDNASRRTSMSYPNGIGTSYSYDPLNRLTRLKADQGATPITDFQYAYDAAGNRSRKQQLDYTEDYAYDALYRLTSVLRSTGLSGGWHYGYDAVGNRITDQSEGSVVSGTYNERNQLLSRSAGGITRWGGTLDEPGNVTFTSALVNGKPARMLAGNLFEADIPMAAGSNTVTVQATDTSANVATRNYQVEITGTGATYTYDLNGNLTQKVEGGVTWTYEWDAENRLKRVLQGGGEVARFAYDALGRRVEKVASGGTTSYAYDGEDILRETTATSTLKYVHGPGIDEALAQEDGTGVFSYFHADGLGSTVKVTSAAGAVTAARRYDAFGSLEIGAMAGYAFTGREWDPEIGLYYYRARYYDPKAGRFLSEDPIGVAGGDVNFYAYVWNNPTRHLDPFGLTPCDIMEFSHCTVACARAGVKSCTKEGGCVCNEPGDPGYLPPREPEWWEVPPCKKEWWEVCYGPICFPVKCEGWLCVPEIPPPPPCSVCR